MNTDRVSYNIKLAVLIRALRNAAGMNQGELCKAANCSRPTVNRIESFHKSSPTGNTIDDILYVFRQMGVEIQMHDDQMTITFNKDFLCAMEQKLQK
jgi:transcriptional regulator with XRE-family HTH domain